ncbi:MAG TPA: NAD(P)/FAD-dependent oxidoreductase [Cyclobacteriaceae bacterium]|nr:NAD(P)/FAD-dependent oxidoreductase [Cyclobacteriaceae bacterium]
MYDLIVLGGGAAGFFAATEAAHHNQDLKILILEKSTKFLSKVRISGGGRCNVTHHCFEPTPLSKHYPRGQKELKYLFKIFHAGDTVDWFKKRGVTLKTEGDGRMFPVTDNSQTIINCFLQEAERNKIDIFTSHEAEKIEKAKNGFSVLCRNGKIFSTKKVLVAIGGHAQPEKYEWLKALGHSIAPPIPSLFTFNNPANEFSGLMGLSVQDAEVKIAGTKFSSRGPVLITHWGLSGPAVIRLSSWAAEYLFEKRYQFTALINWTAVETEESLRALFSQKILKEGGKRIEAHALFQIPKRLWVALCEKAGVTEKMVWAETPAKTLNRLLEHLIRCSFEIRGKTTFKEEFVTCGGVNLSEIDLTTMQSKLVPGLFFAGEVLNIDGETGGFNFQAAWTTAAVAAQSICNA